MMESLDLILWLVLFIIFVVVELATMGLTTIWFAGGALIAIILAACGANPWIQIVVFLIVSLVLVFFTRPIAVKDFNKSRAKTNVETVIGEVAVVTEAIDNLQAKGVVSLNGQEWTARSVSDEILIGEREKVVVRQVEGVKLIVEKQNNQ